LEQEKALSRQRDAVAAARRALPRVKVEQDYRFEAQEGAVRLVDLFGAQSQLIVYHFMFDPTWEQGCKSCSFLADTFNGAVRHLPARDTAFAAISRAPLAKLESFKQRMGWSFRWVSSAGSSFNYDYHVSFRPEEQATGEYNYEKRGFPMSEAPGLSVFAREGEDVFHTYSTYARGLDHLIAAYSYLDLTPQGRGEAELAHPMAWIRHHDRYGSD
jgi:predicted dithiol-disulfide oxidoreductase (DUF899 family)